VWDGPVLLGLLGQHPLDAERLLRRHCAGSSRDLNVEREGVDSAQGL
jgi:hypothetical protein